MEIQFLTFEERVEIMGIDNVLRNAFEEIERLGKIVDGDFNLLDYNDLFSHLRSVGLYPSNSSSRGFIAAWEKARLDFLKSRNRLG
jgi:hypothetical protein